ncbi:MAG: DegT/DnrJ/EryC1/StrS family aminotransferase [Labilithrix sp.]|nr:DegT/DnrJ/EryC1/StrS family aminotransferase [Labilithrix sp.]MCW5814753.1 DegT/DnrJ/EryC1/StrS family aminotransferase [Labilithrix sp.]
MDLKAQRTQLSKELDSAVRDVMDASAFIGGAQLRAFEQGFAAAQGVRHCIGVGNGTDALVVILRALGLGANEVVITAANSFIASSEAVTLAGGRPAFADCGPNYVMTAETLSAAIEREKKAGRRVRGVIVVHLYGRSCDMTALGAVAERHELFVVEDCAQAHLGMHAGKPVGGFGVAAAFSFYPGKNLGAFGDAGAIVSNDAALAERMRMLANHGRKAKYDHEIEGTNSRLDNLQAAVLNVKLPHLRAWTEARIRAADRYRERLANVRGVVVPAATPAFEHVYHLFVVRVANRSAVKEKLAAAGIDTGVHYPHALPDLAAYAYLETRREEHENASDWSSSILSLPMFPEITDAQIDHVADALADAVSGS